MKCQLVTNSTDAIASLRNNGSASGAHTAAASAAPAMTSNIAGKIRRARRR